MELHEAKVVVTGGSQGIGAAMAEAFAQHGADVLVVARSADKLEAVAERIGGSYLVADLTEQSDVDGLFAKCIEQLGFIDVLVNNAGLETHEPFAELPRNTARTLARLNYEAPLLLTRDVLPHMLERGSGHIVNMSSLAGTIAWPGLAAYCGSKAGITNFTETLRMELKGTGIGLTVVAPGPVDTDMWERLDTNAYVAPALKRFRRLGFLPELDPTEVAAEVVRAVAEDKPHVRPAKRYRGYHMLNNAPRRVVRTALTGVKLPPPRVVESSENADAWTPIWPTDNPLSVRWPLYTRGNVGEVFPDVVLPLTWDIFGKRAEDGWRAAFEKMGLLMPGDLSADEDMVILGVLGGYCYINASYVRLLGVRAPGGTVDVIDQQFFGESDAPPYTPAPGDKNVRSSLRLGRTVLRLLNSKELPALEADKVTARNYLDRYPGDDATDEQLIDHMVALAPVFEQLFERHIENTFSVALVMGALVDLITKAGHEDKLVSILGGIGDVESAAPSVAMWVLSRSADANPTVAAAFDAGVPGVIDRLRAEPDARPWLDELDAFIAEFGSRGPNEWDIGSDPWELRPELALAAIDRMRRADGSHDPRAQAARLAAEREQAVAEIRTALNPVDRFQFDKALAATTLYSQARERSKTTIIRAVNGARRAQAELARRIAERGGPSERRKTCLLALDEFRQCVADPTSVASLIEAREAQYHELAERIPPFIVDGSIPDVSTWQLRSADGHKAAAGEVLSGIAGCPGVARGRARVVLDAGDPGDLGPGDVLVAPITDPSWTPLFLAAEAVVVDVGATMSHAVIVSRELGIPCVVSAVGATTTIPDGATLEVDGNTGKVTVIDLP